VAAKGGFQVGQTAKARSDHRVQSLPVRDMAASTFLMRHRCHRARNEAVIAVPTGTMTNKDVPCASNSTIPKSKLACRGKLRFIL
jgi:hypothetical protein